jgi:protein phosphatase PTC7
MKLFSTGPPSDKSEGIANANIFNSGLHMNPHFAKKAKGGEDATCILFNLLAVADGVGGWAESGIDPAIFSRKLCVNIDKEG